jgi:hypothetical protein
LLLSDFILVVGSSVHLLDGKAHATPEANSAYVAMPQPTATSSKPTKTVVRDKSENIVLSLLCAVQKYAAVLKATYQVPLSLSFFLSFHQ